jgi:hypothetical protein
MVDYPIVTMEGNKTKLELYADMMDGDSYGVILKEVDTGDSVWLGFLSNYEAAMEAMETIMTSFAALGYTLDSYFKEEENAKQ